jgi:hypothetical protein
MTAREEMAAIERRLYQIRSSPEVQLVLQWLDLQIDDAKDRLLRKATESDFRAMQAEAHAWERLRQRITVASPTTTPSHGAGLV